MVTFALNCVPPAPLPLSTQGIFRIQISTGSQRQENPHRHLEHWTHQG